MSNSGIACGRVRRLVWPDGGPRAASADLIEAQQHLAQCEDCQRFVNDMRVQAEFVRKLAPRAEAPGDVRRRLFTAVARARAGGGGGTQPPARRMVPLAWLLAAVGLLMVVGGTLAVDHVVRHGTLDPMSVLAEDHARSLGGAQIASEEPARVSRWLARHVDFAMLVPSLPNARLLGARVRVIDGRRGAAVLYDVHGVAVTYFVIPSPNAGQQPQIGAAEPRFERLTSAGYRVVAWREPGLLHAMVGSLSDPQLVTLAQACIKQARGTVASLGSAATSKEV